MSFSPVLPAVQSCPRDQSDVLHSWPQAGYESCDRPQHQWWITVVKTTALYHQGPSHLDHIPWCVYLYVLAHKSQTHNLLIHSPSSNYLRHSSWWLPVFISDSTFFPLALKIWSCPRRLEPVTSCTTASLLSVWAIPLDGLRFSSKVPISWWSLQKLLFHQVWLNTIGIVVLKKIFHTWRYGSAAFKTRAACLPALASR